jgi:hypothetical protein
MDDGTACVSFRCSLECARYSSRYDSLINSDAAVEEEVYYEQPGPK